jgi:hypothetical protein
LSISLPIFCCSVIHNFSSASMANPSLWWSQSSAEPAVSQFDCLCCKDNTGDHDDTLARRRKTVEINWICPSDGTMATSDQPRMKFHNEWYFGPDTSIFSAWADFLEETNVSGRNHADRSSLSKWPKSLSTAWISPC